MKIKNILIATSLIMISTTSFASERDHKSEHKHRKESIIKKFDENKDRKLDESEFKNLTKDILEKKESRFKKIDSNSDGVISIDEFTSKSTKSSFSEIDLNKDGYIDHSEIKKKNNKENH